MPKPGGYRERLHHNSRFVRELAKHQPDVHEAYWKTHEAAMRAGTLDRKTKELVGLALVVAAHCDVCIAFHVRDCLRAGASREEILETLNVTLMEGDGPTMVYAGWAVEAMEEYLAGRSRPGAEPAPHRH